jgi:hypothetical protein
MCDLMGVCMLCIVDHLLNGGHNAVTSGKDKVKAIPVTGRGGP